MLVTQLPQIADLVAIFGSLAHLCSAAHIDNSALQSILEKTQVSLQSLQSSSIRLDGEFLVLLHDMRAVLTARRGLAMQSIWQAFLSGRLDESDARNLRSSVISAMAPTRASPDQVLPMCTSLYTGVGESQRC